MISTYEGQYRISSSSYNYTAWNRAGDLGIFQDDGFVEVFSEDCRDHWVSQYMNGSVI